MSDVALNRRIEAVRLVNQERERQIELFGDQSALPPERWLPILVEEVGEVAEAINEEDFENMFDEIVQVAAVCIAWLEALTPEIDE